MYKFINLSNGKTVQAFYEADESQVAKVAGSQFDFKELTDGKTAQKITFVDEDGNKIEIFKVFTSLSQWILGSTPVINKATAFWESKSSKGSEIAGDYELIHEGHSLVIGSGSTAGNDYPTLLNNMFNRDPSNNITLINKAATNNTILDMISQAPTEIDPLINSTREIVLFWGGIVDISLDDSLTGAETATRVATWVTGRKTANPNVKIVALTMIKSLAVITDFETKRTDFNTALKANSDIDVIIDVGDDPRFDPADANVYSDQTHLTDVGYRFVAEDANDAINGLLITKIASNEGLSPSYPAKILSSYSALLNGTDNMIELTSAIDTHTPGTDVEFTLSFNVYINNFNVVPSLLGWTSSATVYVRFNAAGGFSVRNVAGEVAPANYKIGHMNQAVLTIVFKANHEVDLYVNGVFEETMIGLSNNQFIFNRVGGTSEMSGNYYEFKYFDKALTAQEALDSFDNLPVSNLKIHYDFATGKGSQVYDKSATANHGTVLGTLTNFWELNNGRPNNWIDGFDLWSLDSDPTNFDEYLRAPLQADDTSIKGNGDAITGYTWVAKYTANSDGSMPPAESKLEQYLNSTLFAADDRLTTNFWYTNINTANEKSYADIVANYLAEYIVMSDVSAANKKNLLLINRDLTVEEQTYIDNLLNQ